LPNNNGNLNPKSETLNSKQAQMLKPVLSKVEGIQNSKHFGHLNLEFV
jgi:hypothetical protein